MAFNLDKHREKEDLMLIQCKTSQTILPDFKSLLARKEWTNERTQKIEGIPFKGQAYQRESNIVTLEKMRVSPFARKIILWKGEGHKNWWILTYKEHIKEWRGRRFKSFEDIINRRTNGISSKETSTRPTNQSNLF